MSLLQSTSVIKPSCTLLDPRVIDRPPISNLQWQSVCWAVSAWWQVSSTFVSGLYLQCQSCFRMKNLLCWQHWHSGWACCSSGLMNFIFLWLFVEWFWSPRPSRLFPECYKSFDSHSSFASSPIRIFIFRKSSMHYTRKKNGQSGVRRSHLTRVAQSSPQMILLNSWRGLRARSKQRLVQRLQMHWGRL